MNDLYRELILEQLREPQNVGELTNADVTLRETNASCGDEITIFLKFDKNREKIETLLWTGTGCAISQATMSLLSANLQQKPLSEIQHMQQRDLENLLGIEEISSGRVKCLMLGLKAVQKSLLNT